jgi:type IV pilus assembly protein PilW
MWPSKHLRYYQNLRQSGFTLLEMLIAMALATMLLMTITALFMTFLVSGAKSNIKRTLIREGQYALSQMEFMLRNADTLKLNSAFKTCDPTMDRIAFYSRDGWSTEFLQATDNGVVKIASVGAQPPPSFQPSLPAQYLTSDSVSITNGPSFACNQTGSTVFVDISFTLTKTSTNGSASEDFKSRVQMRNYN